MVGGGPGGPLAFHWDGSALRGVSVLPVGTLQHVLTLGPQDAWAASDTALIHWDGNTWTPVPAPVAGMLAASGPQDLWTVSGAPSPTGRTCRCSATCWAATPSTLCPGAGLPGADQRLYRGGGASPAIRSTGLICWGNNVTRGQAAKIVANAANFQDPVLTTQQTFADVPPTHPFWFWIERIAGAASSAATPVAGRASRATRRTGPTSAPTTT